MIPVDVLSKARFARTRSTEAHQRVPAAHALQAPGPGMSPESSRVGSRAPRLRRRRPRSGGPVRRTPRRRATGTRRSTSGHRSSTNTISAYADCQSRKFDVRCSPPLRRKRSTSGSSGSSRWRCERALVDALRVEPAGGDLAGDGAHGVRDLGPPAVVDAHREREDVVVPGHVLGRLELVDHAAPQPGTASGPADPHPPRVEQVAAAADDVAAEPQEEPHLLRRAPPVLGRERVGGDILRRRCRSPRRTTSMSDASPDLVALRPGQPARVRPASVAVHDDRDVPRHELRRDRRRPRAGRVRRRRDDLARAARARRADDDGAIGTSAPPARARPAAASGPVAPGATAGRPRRCRWPRAADAPRWRPRSASRPRAGPRAA